MNIVDVAERYFNLTTSGNGIYSIHDPNGEFDSVKIWRDTNSYRRFSIGKSGGIKQFLKYIVGLSESEIAEQFGEIKEENALIKALHINKYEKGDTGLALQDIVGEYGYNSYIASRNVSRETAELFNLETKNGDVIIPLYNENNRRIGSLVRNNSPKVKGDRYRTYMSGTNVKPCCWPFHSLTKLNGNSIIILVEGAWSVMRINQIIKPLFPNIVPIATLGTNLTDDLKEYIYEYPIIAIIDSDEGGHKVVETLQTWQEQKITIECYEPTCYVDDLSDKALTSLFQYIKETGKLLKN